MSTLYIHIGTPKTGTSAIQAFMVTNTNLLKRKGFLYPDFEISFPGIGQNRNAHFLVYKNKDVHGKHFPEKDKELKDKCIKKIKDYAEKFENIIISDEGIWHGGGVKKKFWENLKSSLEPEGINIKVILYLRRQDLFIQSYWAQLVKETLTVNFSEYIDKGKYKKGVLIDYYSYLNTISQVIGKENIIVRPYERSQFVGSDNSVISDFLNLLGLNLTNEFKNAEQEINVSLSGSCLEVKRLLNQIPEFKTKQNFVVPLLTKIQSDMNNTTKFNKSKYFSYEKQIKFLSQYDKGNCSVAKEYLGRDNGKLFIDAINKSDNKMKNTQFSIDELVEIFGKVILLQKNKNSRKKEISKSTFLYRIKRKLVRLFK